MLAALSHTLNFVLQVANSCLKDLQFYLILEFLHLKFQQ